MSLDSQLEGICTWDRVGVDLGLVGSDALLRVWRNRYDGQINFL